MNELTKQNNQLQLRQSHPLFQPAVCNEDKEKVFKAVIAGIAKCYADLNWKNPDDQTKTYMANELTTNIIKNFPSMRTVKITEAFSNGIRGKYGEYLGLNVVTFEKFIAGYIESGDWAQLVEEKNKLMIEPRREPTDDQKFDTSKNLFIEAYESYKTGKFIERTSLTNYDFIALIELVNYSKAEKEQFLSDALHIVPHHYEAERLNSKEIWKRRRFIGALATFKECIEKSLPFPEDHKSVIKIIAKKLALKAYFEDSIIENINMADAVEAKREFYKSIIKKQI